MRLVPITLSLLVASLSLSATEGPRNETRPLRAGKGEARVRNPSEARKVSEQAPATGRSVPYRPAKPGEGAPKEPRS
ncbi:hypothetical protein [Mesoterricola silvestris]|uniref:Uncharacterized protein n=1 Tax=Mesoterricola silvestris TaxID=2927979 RepID=A0AA48GUC4_9BACT|nr:hypothetical protein [Mesoterricola silvestris]BDU74520.1 hypothetical protein METEAL_36940 [Mesoterricola silvestris]